MQSSVSKWGNSLAVRLPRAMASGIHLREGTPVDLRVEGESLVITPSRPKYKLSELLAQMKPEHKNQEEDWGEPKGDEEW